MGNKIKCKSRNNENVDKKQRKCEIVVRFGYTFLDDKNMYTLCKFRTTNHRLPVETGRWNNIDRVDRICTKCDNITIGDEYHYIMERELFSNFRNRFIFTNLRERPNILKFKHIMSAYQNQNFEKLCKFIRNINKCFVVYTVYGQVKKMAPTAIAV